MAAPEDIPSHTSEVAYGASRTSGIDVLASEVDDSVLAYGVSTELRLASSCTERAVEVGTLEPSHCLSQFFSSSGVSVAVRRMTSCISEIRFSSAFKSPARRKNISAASVFSSPSNMKLRKSVVC